MNEFKIFVESLPHGKYADFRTAVKLELMKNGMGVSDQTFRNWESGAYVPSDERKAVIDRVAVAMTGKGVFNNAEQGGNGIADEGTEQDGKDEERRAER